MAGGDLPGMQVRPPAPPGPQPLHGSQPRDMLPRWEDGAPWQCQRVERNWGCCWAPPPRGCPHRDAGQGCSAGEVHTPASRAPMGAASPHPLVTDAGGGPTGNRHTPASHRLGSGLPHLFVPHVGGGGGNPWGGRPNPLSHTRGEARLDLEGDGTVSTTDKTLASICHGTPSRPPPPQIAGDPWPQRLVSVGAKQLPPHHSRPFSPPPWVPTTSRHSSEQGGEGAGRGTGFLPWSVVLCVCRLCSLPFQARRATARNMITKLLMTTFKRQFAK